MNIMEPYFYDSIVAWDAALYDLNIKHRGLTGI